MKDSWIIIIACVLINEISFELRIEKIFDVNDSRSYIMLIE